MAYFKKGATGGGSRTAFGGKVGNFLIKNVNINLGSSNKYKRACCEQQLSLNIRVCFFYLVVVTLRMATLIAPRYRNSETSAESFAPQPLLLNHFGKIIRNY